MDQRRRYERFPAKLKAEIRLARGNLQAETSDVSFTGMFLRSETPPPMRELIKISVEHNGLPQTVMGMAVHLVQPKEGEPRYGVGIQLFGLDPAARKRWEQLVRNIQTALRQAPRSARDVVRTRTAATVRPAPSPEPPAPGAAQITPAQIVPLAATDLQYRPPPKPRFQITRSTGDGGSVRVGPSAAPTQDPSLDLEIDVDPTATLADRPAPSFAQNLDLLIQQSATPPDDAALPELRPPGAAPDFDLPAADWAPEQDFYYEAMLPELRLKLSSREELDRIREGANRGEHLHMRTEVYLKPGTQLRLRLLEPTAKQAFVSEAVVEESQPQGDWTELGLRLLPRGSPPTDDVYVTIDLELQP